MRHNSSSCLCCTSRSGWLSCLQKSCSSYARAVLLRFCSWCCCLIIEHRIGQTCIAWCGCTIVVKHEIGWACARSCWLYLVIKHGVISWPTTSCCTWKSYSWRCVCWLRCACWLSTGLLSCLCIAHETGGTYTSSLTCGLILLRAEWGWIVKHVVWSGRCWLLSRLLFGTHIQKRWFGLLLGLLVWIVASPWGCGFIISKHVYVSGCSLIPKYYSTTARPSLLLFCFNAYVYTLFTLLDTRKHIPWHSLTNLYFLINISNLYNSQNEVVYILATF